MVLPFFLLAHSLQGNQESVLNQIMVETGFLVEVPLYSRHVKSINIVCHCPPGNTPPHTVPFQSMEQNLYLGFWCNTQIQILARHPSSADLWINFEPPEVIFFFFSSICTTPNIATPEH